MNYPTGKTSQGKSFTPQGTGNVQQGKGNAYKAPTVPKSIKDSHLATSYNAKGIKVGVKNGKVTN